MSFKYTDKAISYIDKQLIAGFSRLKSILSFDELNVMKEVNSLYQSVTVTVIKVFTKLANQVYKENIRERDLKSLDEEWVDDILSGYDPVSKYVFMHEIDRKCARLIEALMASDNKSQEVDRALRALSFQCRMYADRVTDEALMQAYEDDNVAKVIWRAEKDNKTCSVCASRDGKIYPIDKVPEDPHPCCRCWRERV